MPVTRPGAPVLDQARVDRWAAATVPWWVCRLVLTVGWAVAGLVAVAADTGSCTALDPAVCGPDVTFAVAVVVLFATPVLLWWVPVAGCAAGVVFAVLDLIYDDVRAATVAFAVHGLLCLAVAAWLVTARRRQRAIVSEVATTVRLDAALSRRLRENFPGWGGRTVIAVLLIVAGIGGVTWYDHRSTQVAGHEAAATRVDAVVRGGGSGEGAVVVEVPRPVRIDVLDSCDAGQVVPVLVDGSWVRLVAEPEDVTPWLSGGLGAFALAGFLLFREQRMRSARRRLLTGSLPAVELTAEPDDEGRAVLHDGMAVVPVVSSPLRLDRPHLTGEDVDWDDRWTDDEDFGRHWRGADPADAPRTVTVAGDLRDGGWVLLITDTAVLLPEAPLRTPRERPSPLPGQPLSLPDPGDLPDLPVVLRPRPLDRALGAVSLLGFAAGPAAVLAGLPDGWWETVVVLWAGGALAAGGWGRLHAQVRLTSAGLVVHDRTRVHQVPWPRLHGLRRDGGALWLAWDPETTVRVSGVTDHWGAVLTGLRDRSLAAGDPGGQVTSRLGGYWWVGLAYTVVAIASVRHR